MFGLLAPVGGGDVDYCDGLAGVGRQGSGGFVEGLVVDGEFEEGMSGGIG